MRKCTLAACLLIPLPLLLFASTARSDTTTFSYDELGRLKQVTTTVGTGTTSTYNYDPADNRSSVTVATGTGGTCGSASFLIASNGAVTEGSGSIFTVTKSGSPSIACSVSYNTSDGTALQPGDYTAKSGVLTFLAGTPTQTVAVTTIDDTAVESAETFTMALSSPSSGGTISTPSATATINDNDSAQPCTGISFSVASNAAVTEGSPSTFTITKTGTTSGTCTVNYATANGTAVQPGDYTAASGIATFAAGTPTQTVTVTTSDDSNVESAETFTLTLSSPSSGATLGTATATATINDNDSVVGPSFSVNNVTGDEGTTFVFTITKAGTATGNITVNYATANNTAVANGDYNAKSGSVTFLASDTTKTVSVTVNINGLNPEPTETFYLNLTGTGVTFTDSQGVGTIYDVGDNNPCPLC